MAEPLLLGVDEGTTGVKAALFTRELKQVGEARRDKVNRHPQAGWVEQDGDEVLAAVVDAVAELLADPPGEVVACGLDHQGESVLAWDAESGDPLTPIVVWQDKRSQEVLDRLAEPARTRSARRAAFRSIPTSRPPSSPGCSSTTRGSRALGSAARCGWAPSTRSSATVSAPASPPIPRRRRGPSSSESTPRAASIPAFARSSGSRSTCCRRSAIRRATSASSPTRAGRPRCRCVGRPSISRRRSRARGLWSPAGSRRPTGPGSSSSPTWASRSPSRPAVCCRPSPGRSTAESSTRSTAACSRPGRCSSGSVASSASPPTRRRSASSPATRTTPAGSVSCPGWRAWERRGGGRTPAPSSPGSGAGRPPRRSRARRSRGSPGASRTSSRRSGSRSRSTACGSTAGSRTSR